MFSTQIIKDEKIDLDTIKKSNHIGFVVDGFETTLIELDNRLIQVYVVLDDKNKKKILGHYYERLPNGTGKNIGSFILNQTNILE